ncbi:unnamed protein product [Adineta steineri]|uniref:Transmembrane protein n=1 Tax=Adineta steineri TaxID=433720 RepID=A0A814D4H6_9BILA|nr:unnamed protein product [Adineta steineri]CAF1417523.1 unnamed protein product [Adineta steineri]CAF1491651.1 unnamed protein product [Adineta steineri]
MQHQLPNNIQQLIQQQIQQQLQQLIPQQIQQHIQQHPQETRQIIPSTEPVNKIAFEDINVEIILKLTQLWFINKVKHNLLISMILVGLLSSFITWLFFK